MVKECITHMFVSYEKYDLNTFRNMIKSMHEHIKKKYGELSVKYFWSMSYPTWLKLEKWYPGLCETEFGFSSPTSRFFLEIEVNISDILSDDIVDLIAKEKVNYMEKFYIGGAHRHPFLDNSVDMYKKQVNAIYGLPPHLIMSDLSKAFKLPIKEVIYNKPATIIYWKDGSKTVVKCKEDEAYDKEKGFVMAVIKYILGNKGNYYETIKKWVPYEKAAEENNIQEEYAQMIEEAYNEGYAKAAAQVKELETPVLPECYLTTKQYAAKVHMSESTIRHKCLNDPGFFKGKILRGPQGYQIPWYGEE